MWSVVRVVRRVLSWSVTFGYLQYPSLNQAIGSIGAKLGVCPESLRNWVRQADIDVGVRPGTTSEESARIEALEREVAELRRADGILKAAVSFFAAELDRPLPRS